MHLPAIISAVVSLGQKLDLSDYSHAHLLDWEPSTDGPTALEAAYHGFDFLTRQFWREDGGFVFSVKRNGSHADTRVESYEQAFAIFAFAWHFRATGDAAAVEWAERTLADLGLAGRAGGRDVGHQVTQS